MSGFRTVAQWADAHDAGRSHTTAFRKQVASAVTSANQYIDYTYFSGNPVANFYASSPLEVALIETDRGIALRNIGKSQWLKDFCVMSAAANTTATTSQNQLVTLADYLLYYPFVDTDAVGEVQAMVQSVAVPRYAQGGNVIAVSQSASSTVGTFTMTYTNQDGVSGRVSPPNSTQIVTGGGILLTSATGVAADALRFVKLQAGDTWVRSIEEVAFTAGGGGLMALVIVRPLLNTVITEECRRSFESHGAATHIEALIHTPPAEIKQGAVLGVIGLGNAGSLASSVLSGVLTTQWS